MVVARILLAGTLGIAGIVGPMDYTRDQLEDLVRWAARYHSIDEDTFVKLVEAESSFNPKAKNDESGCLGLLQLNPRFFGNPSEDLRDPEINVRLGADYFAQLLRLFDGSYFQALVAWNWGEGHLMYAKRQHGWNWFKEMPEETKVLLRKVLL